MCRIILGELQLQVLVSALVNSGLQGASLTVSPHTVLLLSRAIRTLDTS